ncbi:LPS-assembly protein [Litorimonas taeanensis]|uniref:LPS-assembly protein LptD n=2 Tax=Litorimonas taeanensis TaxID=568099 RepID=A0A420WEX3_9PROT|nr:LPS-assembly protein [Litorimonas taeanensis]
MAGMTMALTAATASAQIGVEQTAAGTNRPLELADDSPFRDPDLFYLEADSLTSNEDEGILTVQGQVEGRYEDRSLRADEVVYNRNTGRVIASGNVTLIDATGSVQYADKLELSEALEAGTATNYTGRIQGGGVVGARFVNRNTNEEFEFYNAYYTACEICREDGEVKKPAWRLRAKRVRQDRETRTIRYNDAVLELLGLPVFYTPYLAHPDPSAKRASGLLAPFMGVGSDKGFTVQTPYYWAIDESTELTVTPRIFTKVNPLLGLEFAQRFHTGRIDLEGSLTYGSVFDRDGNAFDDPTLFANPSEAPIDKRWRSHLYADGYFQPSDFWDYGFGVQLSSDDTYLNRYDLNESPGTRGLYQSESRRNTSQAFVIGQNDNTRFSVSTVAFQDLRSRFTELDNGQIFYDEFDDSQLPVLAPKVEAESYFQDPVLGGRLKAFGDTTWLTRKVGTDYGRATAGLDYSKTWIAPAGVEIKPFAQARVDYFELEPDGGSKTEFSRTLGQIGADFRYPLIKSTSTVDWILEPRVQITQSFGDGKLNEFIGIDGTGSTVSLLQDGTNIDLDQSQFWNSNKNGGYDLWEEGFRADVGGSVIADWNDSRAHLFVGQSYTSGVENRYDVNTGLEGSTSDIIGLFELNLGQYFSTKTRLRFNDDEGEFRRIDSSLRFRTDRFNAGARYYRVEDDINTIEGAPTEEISGSLGFKITDKWSTRYTGYYDVDTNDFRRQRLSLAYQDDCTLIELTYNRNNISNDAVRDSSGFGIRIALLSLGDSAN